jgi:hypothetical protein
MTYEELVTIFKDAAESYVPVDPTENGLSFHYNAVWYNNGAPANKYPSMLFEQSPDFELVGVQSNNRTGKQVFSGKLFFYDTYYEKERGEDQGTDYKSAAYKKQSRLNELALQVLGEINRRTDLAPTERISWGKGFFGIDVHNPKLVQVFIPFTATLRSECTSLPQ